MGLRSRVNQLKEILEGNHLTISQYYLEGEEVPWMREEVVDMPLNELNALLDQLGHTSDVKTLSELKAMLKEDYKTVVQSSGDVRVTIGKNDLFNYLDQLLEANERHLDDWANDVILYQTTYVRRVNNE